MRKAISLCLVLFMMVMTGCETPEPQNSQASEPSSVVEESSASAEEVKSLWVLREGEFPRKPHTPDQEEIEQDRKAAYDWLWERRNDNPASDFDASILADVEIIMEEVPASQASSVYCRGDWLIMRSTGYKSRMVAYKREDGGLRFMFEQKAQNENFIQDVMLTESYLFWSEHTPKGTGWSLYYVSLSEPETPHEILDSTENSAVETEPDVFAMQDQLIVELDYKGQEYGTVCGYDPRTDTWTTLFQVGRLNLQLLGRGDEVYGADYDGKQWYALRYNLKTKEIYEMPLDFNYDTEWPIFVDLVGEWVVYHSSCHMQYAKNDRTGEVRILPETFLFRGLGDRYVVYTVSSVEGNVYLYDFERDESFKIDIGKEECSGFLFGSGEMGIALPCDRESEEGTQTVIHIREK
ncbi:MAG TPA: hypothetical protein IAC91_02290 [Candidatus Faecimorpha stercoravium]|nr:hypothetical protein [Candidatus Faecimorpha stercoravium]